MPSRVIRGEINSSRSLSRVSMEADLTFRALIVAVDDWGRVDGRLCLLRAMLYPARAEVTDDRLDGWIRELEVQGCVRRYQVDGEDYLCLPSWERHRGNTKRAVASRIPEPTQDPQDPQGNSDFPRGIAADPQIAQGNCGSYSEGEGEGVGVGEEEGECEGEEASFKPRLCEAEPAAPDSAPPKPPRKRVDPEPSPEARELTRGYLDSLRAPFPRLRDPTPSAYARWEAEMDRLLRLDGRSQAEVIDLVRWLYDPSPRASPDALFWRANVQSVPKLREKWDQLMAVKERINGSPTRKSVDEAVESIRSRFTGFVRDRGA